MMDLNQPARALRVIAAALGIFAAALASAQGYRLDALDASLVGNSIPEYDYGPGGSSTMQFDAYTTFSGTLDNTGTAKSLYSNITENRLGPYATDNITDSLYSGSIHAYHADNSVYGAYAEGRTHADLYDTANFTNSSAGPSDQTTVYFKFTLTGTSSISGNFYPGGALNAYFGVDTTYQNLFNFPLGSVTVNFAPGGDSYTGTSNWTGTPDSLTDLESFTFTGPTASIGVGMNLDASGSGMAYNYTYSLQILTSGTTSFTSDSGVLLSQPLPEAPGFAALGLGILPLLLRKRRRLERRLRPNPPGLGRRAQAFAFRFPVRISSQDRSSTRVRARAGSMYQ